MRYECHYSGAKSKSSRSIKIALIRRPTDTTTVCLTFALNFLIDIQKLSLSFQFSKLVAE